VEEDKRNEEEEEKREYEKKEEAQWEEGNSEGVGRKRRSKSG
jgi:hypothetical protein